MQAGDRSSREAAIDAAFNSGDHQRGLSLLRELANEAKGPALLHRLGVIEEQIGTAERALAAHLECLSLAPNNPVAYLYAGYCLQQQGRDADALALYSLGSDLDGSLLAPPDPQREPAARERLDSCNSTLRQYFSELHRQSVGADDAVKRIRDAIWVRTHDTAVQRPTSGQQPHLFYVPELPPIRYAAREQLPWVNAVEAAAEGIAAEFHTALPVISGEGRPYLAEGMALGGELGSLVGSLNWTALDLFRDGRRNDAIADHFPVTLAALSQAPLYGLDERPFEIFFSVLKPGQHISPHYGLSNHSLTVHLPMITPPDCELVVGGEARTWEPGKIIAFDDTFLHEAINRSDQDRVVLIFSVWHPDLSEAECDAVQRSFQARQAWLDQRAVPAF